MGDRPDEQVNPIKRPQSEHVQPMSMPGYALPTYAFRPPPELTGADRRRYPVIIVGAGLAGLTLALDLGLRGVPVVVLDEDDSVGAAGLSSRGVVYVHRTLEIFDRLGVADRVIGRGSGWTLGRVFKGGEEVYAFSAQSRGRSRLPANANLQQFFVEEYLVERILEVPLIDLRWRSRVTGIEAHEDRAVLQVETPDGAYAIESDWVAACDGGASFIREALNAPSETHWFDDAWCIADIRPTSGNPDERRVWMDAAFNAGGVVLNHNMAEGVCRFNFQISHYEDVEEAGAQNQLRARLAEALGPGVDYEFVWTGVWRYKRRLLDQFVHGRVVFVGDSAHQVPPFGARGGNAGVADADNLGWKLAAVVQGRAAPELIQTYHAERHAAAVENAEVTSRSARFLTPDTPGRRLFRDAVLSLAHDLAEIRPLVNTGRLAIAQHYPDSPVNMGGRWSGADGVEEGSPPVDGELLWPDGRVGALLDLVKEGFAVLWFVPEGQSLPFANADLRDLADASVRCVAIGRTPLTVEIDTALDPDGTLFKAYGAEAGATYLLRPDGYVALREAGLVMPPLLGFLRKFSPQKVEAA